MGAEATDEPADPPAGLSPSVLVSALLRRIRRAADLSQRELAAALGVSPSTVARAETGHRDLPATVLVRAAELASLRLALVDDTGAEVPGMHSEPVTDRSGRRFPAHLDPRHGDVWWWHGSERYSRQRPRYTFDRDRRERDERRALDGTPPDHRTPRPGDSLRVRASVRAAAARIEAADRRAAWVAERGRLGVPPPDALEPPACTCPAECDELLFAEAPLTPRQQAVPHVPDCACRCDIA